MRALHGCGTSSGASRETWMVFARTPRATTPSASVPRDRGCASSCSRNRATGPSWSPPARPPTTPSSAFAHTRIASTEQWRWRATATRPKTKSNCEAWSSRTTHSQTQGSRTSRARDFASDAGWPSASGTGDPTRSPEGPARPTVGRRRLRLDLDRDRLDDELVRIVFDLDQRRVDLEVADIDRVIDFEESGKVDLDGVRNVLRERLDGDLRTRVEEDRAERANGRRFVHEVERHVGVGLLG